MSKANRFATAASLIAMTAVISACATGPQVQSDFVKRSGDDIGLASKAALALAAKDLPNAILYAERAVARTPDDAGFRALLGNSYFAAGRFHSAEMAYKDALSIYSEQPQVVLKLALAQIALGKHGEALGTLHANRFTLRPADYGLALALAGKPADAVDVLLAAARDTGADARLRQNLALAYAFSGDWTQARTVAAQDVPADKLDARIQQWMQLAKPQTASAQVAALIGVTPAAVDAGQPVRLALVKPDTLLAKVAPAAPVVAVAPVPAPVRVAAPVAARAPAPVAVPVATPVVAPVAVAAVAPVAPPPVVAEAAPSAPPPVMAEVAPPPPPPSVFPQFAEAVPPAPPPPRRARHASSPAPVTAALIGAASNVRTAFAEMLPHVVPARAAKPVPVARPARKPAVRVQQAALRRGNSSSVVQLGAYGSPQGVNAGWNHLTSRYPALRAYLPMRAKFVSPKGTFWRLSITGFADQREALSRCQLLKSRGGACFVRNVAGDAPVQYASR
jgi:Flp pilus assembly protein TadD